jgi:hypothetical protein
MLSAKQSQLANGMELGSAPPSRACQLESTDFTFTLPVTYVEKDVRVPVPIFIKGRPRITETSPDHTENDTPVILGI